MCLSDAIFTPTKQGFDKGEGMGYKKCGKVIRFADLAVSKFLEHNRSLKTMNSIDKVVKCKGADALLLQKWLRFPLVEDYAPDGIPSDPELENQINDRISLKMLLGLPMDKLSPSRA